MTATEHLRALLDERGVEWTYGDGTVSFASDGHWCHAWAYNDNTMCVSMGYFTPEQAVEATLGRGTCEDMSGGDPCVFVCSCCGATFDHPEDERVCYCPNCGRRVVE